MTESSSQEGDYADDNRLPEPEHPRLKWLVKAYIQYSEESRYRDGLMHNSYYLILIAFVLFVGHIVSLDLSGNWVTKPRFWFLIFAGGVVAIGVGVVMKTYNRKKIKAEDQRQVLEAVLDECFTDDGIFQDYGNDNFEPREEDNPFAMQETVIGREQGLVESAFKGPLKVNNLSSIFIVTGAFVSLLAIGASIATVVAG